MIPAHPATATTATAASPAADRRAATTAIANAGTASTQ